VRKCLACPLSLPADAPDSARLCSECHAEYTKTTERWEAGYIAWEIRFVRSHKGKGKKFPDGKWYRFFAKSGEGDWRELT